MGLINSSDYDGLPTEPVSRWLKLKDFLDKRLTEVTDFQNGISTEDLEEYCIVLVNTARTLGLGDFSESADSNIADDHKYYRTRLIALAANLSIKAPTINLQNSVALPRMTKAKIFTQIERLRGMVTEADLSDNQRKKLFAKLDELHSLVVAPRSDFARIMIVMAAVATFVGETTGFVADAPIAVANIRALIDVAIEDEQEEQRLLNEAQKPLRIADQRPRTDLDENPF